MNDQKIVDCVKWKHELHEKAYKASGARNFAEYIAIVNTAVGGAPGQSAGIERRPTPVTERA